MKSKRKKESTKSRRKEENDNWKNLKHFDIFKYPEKSNKIYQDKKGRKTLI